MDRKNNNNKNYITSLIITATLTTSYNIVRFSKNTQ
jgi:hypothetical protein